MQKLQFKDKNAAWDFIQAVLEIPGSKLKHAYAVNNTECSVTANFNAADIEKAKEFGGNEVNG